MIAFLWDLIVSITPPMIGAAIHVLARRRILPSRWIGVSLGIVAVLLIIAFQLDRMPIGFAQFVSLLGGSVVIAGWLMLAVLGYGRSTSGRFFQVFLVGIILAVIAVESSGRLWYGWMRSPLWNNRPDARGVMKQAMPTSCGPCSVAMLLHRVGVECSEGELAHAAKSSPLFGTREQSLSWIIDQRAAPLGSRSEIRTGTYDEFVERGGPFIAFLKIGRVGVHAVMVEQIEADRVTMLDPLVGEARLVTRELFESLWTSRGIGLCRIGSR